MFLSASSSGNVEIDAAIRASRARHPKPSRIFSRVPYVIALLAVLSPGLACSPSHALAALDLTHTPSRSRRNRAARLVSARAPKRSGLQGSQPVAPLSGGGRPNVRSVAWPSELEIFLRGQTAPGRGSRRLLGELARLSAPVRATCAPVRRRRASGSRPTDAFSSSRGDARGEDRGLSLTRLQVSRRPGESAHLSDG